MEYILIPFIAAIASLLTFFSGFGLGTILTPAFMIFFPVELAIAMTGIVHFLNNLFKIALVKDHINYKVLLKFGLTAIIGAYFGAKLLFLFENTNNDIQFEIFSNTLNTTTTNIIIALVMIVFALFDILPKLKSIMFSNNIVYLGGAISGFFGGLSGHQGALRSAFLLKFNLDKNVFIATGIGIACLVDITRLSVYYSKLKHINIENNINLIVITCLTAFVGAFLGKKLLNKVTINFVQNFVGIAIILLAIGLGFGIF